MLQTIGYAAELFDVVAFTWKGEYTLWLKFDDNTERIIDFAPILSGPVWGTLRDINLFREARLDEEIGTIVWPGDLDIDPNVLHDWPEHVAYIVEKREQQSTPVRTPAVAEM
ncbi:MAG: DUF2442 domain-containing protein [Caldilineaceae bacterium]|nr:DUF2442 domain-containing protein [Caldilineaceae bacterium]